MRRALALVRPAAGASRSPTLLGAGAACAAVGLLATSAWLISRAAQQPGASALVVAIAGVQFFALSRGLARYGERLTGHDARVPGARGAARDRLPAARAARARRACRRSATATCWRGSCTTSTRCRTCCCGRAAVRDRGHRGRRDGRAAVVAAARRPG